MFKYFASEVFKEIHFEHDFRLKYAISNYGRMVSYRDKIENGKVLKGSFTEGFRVFKYRSKQGEKIKYHNRFFYKLVAEYFLEKPKEDEVHLIHKDHNIQNDHYENLEWVTKEVYYKHQQSNPKFIENIEKLRQYNKIDRLTKDGKKLTITEVIRLKKRLADPNRKTRMKMLAKQFGISEMQVYRIKNGENWGHIKI